MNTEDVGFLLPILFFIVLLFPTLHHLLYACMKFVIACKNISCKSSSMPLEKQLCSVHNNFLILSLAPLNLIAASCINLRKLMVELELIGKR